MSNIDYRHNIPLSLEAKLIQFILGLFGVGRKLERKMINNGFAKEPARLPKSLYRHFNIQEGTQNGRTFWTISPVKHDADVVILYLHGGAYMGNIMLEHWHLAEQLIVKTGATLVMPDYPLAPEATYKETYEFIEALYLKLITDYPGKRFIFMGDSAGGGLSLGFVQKLRLENLKLPNQIIVFSPWLDIAMDNPDLKNLEKGDKILSIKGLKNAGQKYAGNLNLKDYRVSPLYGDLSGLCPISIFTGTNDLLHADARRCKQLLIDKQVIFNYFEYPGLFHDWVIIASLKESRDVLNIVYNLLDDKE